MASPDAFPEPSKREAVRKDSHDERLAEHMKGRPSLRNNPNYQEYLKKEREEHPDKSPKPDDTIH